MISAAEAQNIILDSARQLSVEAKPLIDALGHVLAEDIVAKENIPPFDNSAMDGFAVRANDVQSVPVVLNVVDEVAAGHVSARKVEKGQTIRVMTGGKIPEGADAVVQIEWTEPLDDQGVKVLQSVPSGHNVRKAGVDIRAGERVLEQGREIRAAELGVLASLGKSTVSVYYKPRVGILATGDELVEVSEGITEGKIRNSNSYTLYALCKEAGAIPVMLGMEKDEKAKVREKIQQGLTYDVLITSGGVSVGKYDIVQEVLQELGVQLKFWKVNIKPGMPLLFGVYSNTLVFGLPGNPVSTMVTFLKFVRPALWKLIGKTQIEESVKLRARLEHDLKKSDKKRHFVRGILEQRNGTYVVRTTGSQISNVLTSMVKANCFIIVPEEKGDLQAGEMVEVELL